MIPKALDFGSSTSGVSAKFAVAPDHPVPPVRDRIGALINSAFEAKHSLDEAKRNLCGGLSQGDLLRKPQNDPPSVEDMLEQLEAIMVDLTDSARAVSGRIG